MCIVTKLPNCNKLILRDERKNKLSKNTYQQVQDVQYSLLAWHGMQYFAEQNMTTD